MLAHQAFPLHITVAFTFSGYAHPQVMFYSLCFPVQHLAILWGEVSHSPDGLGCKWVHLGWHPSALGQSGVLSKEGCVFVSS